LRQIRQFGDLPVGVEDRVRVAQGLEAAAA
jgi:hypothetical protein